LLVLLSMVLVTAVAAGDRRSQVFMNDTGAPAYGLSATFDRPVEVQRLGEGFTQWLASDGGRTIVFFGGEVSAWGSFYFFWSPAEAKVTEWRWLGRQEVSVLVAETPQEKGRSDGEGQFSETLFEEGFEDLAYQDLWSFEGGADVVALGNNNVLRIDAYSSEESWGYAHPHFEGWWNYTLELRFRIDKRHQTGYCMVRFRRLTGDTWYGVLVTADHITLQKFVDGEGQDLDSYEGRIPADQWVKMQIIAEEGYIAVYLNAQICLSFLDDESLIPYGGIEIVGGEGMISYFDNFLVKGEPVIPYAKWTKTGGPHGGLGYDVRIDPVDPNIIYVTDTFSGVNKSVDGGETWFECNEGITSRGGKSGDAIPVFCLTIDPVDHNILWAGTLRAGGVFKSTDGGRTWVRKTNGIDDFDADAQVTFRDFEVNPEDNDIVFVAVDIEDPDIPGSYGQVYKTVDGGEHWYKVLEAQNLFRPIIIDPENPDIVYAATGIFDRNSPGVEGVFKSVDGGETWFHINNGFPLSLLDGGLVIGYLDMDPDNPRTLYAAVGREPAFGGSLAGGVFKTTNGGESWEWVLREGWPFTVVSVAPSDPNIVYAGQDMRMWKSTDGGNTWRCLGFNCPGYFLGIPIGIAVDPRNPDVVYVNNYNGGVFKSTDGGETWRPASRGYTGATVTDIALVNGSPDELFAMANTGLFFSPDGGNTYLGRGIREFEVGTCVAISPQDPNRIYAANSWSGAVYFSSDGGLTWRELEQFCANSGACAYRMTAIQIAPSDPRVIYVALTASQLYGNIYTSPEGYAGLGIYKSSDEGITWRQVNTGIPKGYEHIMDLKVAPHDSQVAYAAVHQMGVYKTVDGGESWFPINNGLSSPYVSTIAIDPTDPEVVYVGTFDGLGVFKSTDGGQHWFPTSEGISLVCPSYLRRVGSAVAGVTLEKPQLRIAQGSGKRQRYPDWPWSTVSEIVIDPNNPDVLYVGDWMLGVYMSRDGGRHWIPINESLTMKAVLCLALSNDGRVLYAGTEGGGVFKLVLPQTEPAGEG